MILRTRTGLLLLAVTLGIHYDSRHAGVQPHEVRTHWNRLGLVQMRPVLQPRPATMRPDASRKATVTKSSKIVAMLEHRPPGQRADRCTSSPSSIGE